MAFDNINMASALLGLTGQDTQNLMVGAHLGVDMVLLEPWKGHTYPGSRHLLRVLPELRVVSCQLNLGREGQEEECFWQRKLWIKVMG